MTKKVPLLVASLSLTLVFGLSLMAQETTELSILVKKNGKVVKDTTYQFDNEDDAMHAMKMVEHMNGQKGSKTMVFISEDGEGHDVVKKKEVKVIVQSDEGGSWTVDSKELKEIDEDVYIIEEDDDLKVEMKKILKEHDGEEGSNVKVIVIKKDEDHDEDEDHDVDVEVEVVTKKKEKK